MHPASDLGTFGTRLHAARLQAGLSQVELAGDDFHASYVSLLESDKRTPTHDIVAAVALRLGVSEDYLLHGDDPVLANQVALAVTYAEIAVRNGEAEDALAQIDALVARGGQLSPRLHAQAHRVRAQALEAVGRLRDAATELEELAAAAQDGHRWNDYLAITVDLVRCYQQAGDNDHSIDLARSALSQVNGLGLAGSDEHARLAATLVGSYYVRGDLTKAAIEAQQALAAVESRGSATARGSVLWNASLVAEAAGNIDEALALAERALASFADGDDARALARLQVAYAWLLLRTTPPQPQEARKLLTKAHKTLKDVGAAADLASVETELAVAALMLDEPERALSLLDDASNRLSDDSPIEQASARLIRGRVLMSMRRRAQATREYRAAAETLAQTTSGRTAAAAWRELADAYVRLGMVEEAALAYQQALTDVGIAAAPGVDDRTSRREPTSTSPRGG